MPQVTRYLEDERMEEFLSLKDSKSTQSTYRRGLRHFIDYYGMKHGADFNDFLKKIFEEFSKPLQEQRRIIEPELVGFIEYLKERGYANKSIRAWLAAVQNYLKYNHVTVSLSFVGNLPQPTTLKINNKHEWTLKQVKDFMDHASNHRDKAVILCLFQSGLGIKELLSLNYGDVKEDLEDGKIPIHLKLVRQETGVQFRTYFGRDAAKYLKLYLETRNNLTQDTPLFTKWGSNTERLTVDAVEKKLREIAESVDFIKDQDLAEGYNPARPHSLRAGFRSRLTGKVADPLIEFWMGHTLNEQVRAYINLPEEEFRELYMDAEKYLAIEKTSRDELEERKRKVLKVSDEYERRIEKLEGYIEILRTKNKDLELEQRKLNGVKAENLELKSRMAKLELETTEKTGRLKKVEAEVLRLKEAVEKLLET